MKSFPYLINSIDLPQFRFISIDLHFYRSTNTARNLVDTSISWWTFPHTISTDRHNPPSHSHLQSPISNMQSALSRPILRLSNLTILRSFSVAPAIMGAGDLGAPKPRGFMAEKDSFARREAAHELMYIREQEMDKVKRLRQKLKEQRQHMDELDKHLEEFAKSQGGEQN
ncbi:hypothetical protein N7499_011119 [Penicillium canescens]|nr:hypothetical protein N7499_011119 [Penicillium canescens]KAJ6182718.1 hypothetical protein N7485_001360 [Penicillium canescens]